MVLLKKYKTANHNLHQRLAACIKPHDKGKNLRIERVNADKDGYWRFFILNFYIKIMKNLIRKIAGKMLKPLFSLKSKIYVKKLLLSNSNIMLEVGAGEKKGSNGWTTLDLKRKCDIYCDLRYGIPFPKNSVSKIYSSHLLEHLTFKEGQVFLQECLRVLVPNGIFSICVPNARIYIEAYIKNEKLDCSKFYLPGYNNTTKIDYVNYTAYMDGHHKYMFDEENILCILAKAGFREVKLRCFDNSLDLEERDYESIYAEAIK